MNPILPLPSTGTGRFCWPMRRRNGSLPASIRNCCGAAGQCSAHESASGRAGIADRQLLGMARARPGTAGRGTLNCAGMRAFWHWQMNFAPIRRLPMRVSSGHHRKTGSAESPSRWRLMQADRFFRSFRRSQCSAHPLISASMKWRSKAFSRQTRERPRRCRNSPASATRARRQSSSSSRPIMFSARAFSPTD